MGLGEVEDNYETLENVCDVCGLGIVEAIGYLLVLCWVWCERMQ